MADAGGPFPNLVAESTTVKAWLRAAEGVASRRLEELYNRLAVEVAERSPVCRTSGRCCRFESWGHLLYVTGFEAAYLWRRLGGRELSAGAVAEARLRGGCPFQGGSLCTVHDLRPLGCRIFFCDESSREWQEHMYERFQRELRELHDAEGLDYLYAEWRALLGLFAGTTDEISTASPGTSGSLTSEPPAQPVVLVTIEGSAPPRRAELRS
ncbi:MAG: hypothetical protein GIKADHBN_00204 [Phycisphaerales bacterium]|nr:hypothetical protein [Phycisphaerales bacterium]